MFIEPENLSHFVQICSRHPTREVVNTNAVTNCLPFDGQGRGKRRAKTKKIKIGENDFEHRLGQQC